MQRVSSSSPPSLGPLPRPLAARTTFDPPLPRGSAFRSHRSVRGRKKVINGLGVSIYRPFSPAIPLNSHFEMTHTAQAPTMMGGGGRRTPPVPVPIPHTRGSRWHPTPRLGPCCGVPGPAPNRLPLRPSLPPSGRSCGEEDRPFGPSFPRAGILGPHPDPGEAGCGVSFCPHPDHGVPPPLRAPAVITQSSRRPGNDISCGCEGRRCPRSGAARSRRSQGILAAAPPPDPSHVTSS